MTSSDKELNKFIREKNFQSIVKHIIKNSESVLDIGCGIGDYLKYTNNKQRVVAVEPHLPYLEKAKEVAHWSEFVNDDALSYLKSTEEKFDCILLIDVVEHLLEEDAVKLVEEAKKHCRKIVFSQIPIGEHEQHEDIWNLGGEKWQTHRSKWDKDNIDKLGFSFIHIWNDWYDWDHKDRRTSIALWFDYPIISVVVPSYNQAEWLSKTLDSIINQTYPFWEAIVVNDGSIDKTKEVIEQYEKIDNRIKGIYKENGGISSALNAGINVAKGKYFCWLSSDDLFYPEKLELQIEAFEKLDESYGIIFGQFDLIDTSDNINLLNQNKPFFDGLEFPQQLKYDIIDGCTIMIPMRIMKELGGFNLQFKHAQDTEFWFRLAAKGYKFYYIDKKITKRRIHEQQGFTDFNLDCRYDGYWLVDYYLSNYSFNDFYKSIDFSKSEDLEKFTVHFFDMIMDPNCHINHPLVNKIFWEWFENGLKTLSTTIRRTILKKGIEIFSSKKDVGQFYQQYILLLRRILEKVGNGKPIPVELRNDFADITMYDRTKDERFVQKLYDFGIEQYNKHNYQIALSAFKYLSDFPNKHYNESFEKFFELVLRLNEYSTFIKSFRRKENISKFPDKIKMYFIISKISLGLNDEGTKLAFNSIQDEKARETVKNWLAEKQLSITEKDIQHWNYQVIPYNIHHNVDITCPSCSAKMSRKIVSSLFEGPVKTAIFCKSCLNRFEFDEQLLRTYFLSLITRDKETVAVAGRKAKVVFVMRYTDIISGGVKVAYRHMQWLNELGCDITIYSDAPKPEWIKLPAKFVRVKDHYEINNLNADAVIVFSVYDVPKMLTKIDANKIYHICQGYEGYHIGRNYHELRSDKFFYTTLHSLPVQNILVSNHLMQMFEEKFRRKGSYIPNSIDLKTFYPDPRIVKEPNSILFIGNPNDPLKGIKFLIDTLVQLQKSNESFKQINPYIVWGGTKLNGDEKTINIAGIKINYLTGLASKEVAALMNRVSLVVNCSWYEGFTLPVLEAMACGTPTIATNNMGAESFCVDGENSFIVKHGDKDAFAERIKDILLQRIDITSIVKNGFNTALEYSGFNGGKRFVEEYSKILRYEFDEQKIKTFLQQFNFDSYVLEERLQMKLDAIKPSDNPNVSIILITYNQVEYTLECLESIRQFTKVPYEIIVVDNASSDNTCMQLRSMINIKLIENKSNLGFPNAVNQGIIASKGKYILLLNNDTLVTSNWLERMIEVLESNPSIGIVGPTSNIVSGVQIDKNAKYTSVEEMHKYAVDKMKSYKGKMFEFPRVAFLCTLIRREVINKIGGLDERFSPGNYEDDDFCLRAQLAGYKAVVVTDVFIHHFGSKSFKANGNQQYAQRLETNKQKFVEKWNATPDELWLQNKPINSRQYFYPIDKNLFLQSINRANVHIADKEYDLAQNEIKKAVENYPSDESNKNVIKYDELLDLAANIALLNKDLAASQEFFEAELNANPSSSTACYGLGQIFLSQELYEQAKVMFEWSVRNDESNEAAREALANVNELLGYEISHTSLVE